MLKQPDKNAVDFSSTNTDIQNPCIIVGASISSTQDAFLEDFANYQVLSLENGKVRVRYARHVWKKCKT